MRPALFLQRTRLLRPALLAWIVLATAVAGAPEAAAQEGTTQVRQLVTFHFLPGRAAEARAIYREAAVPLYRQDEAMRSFRALREVESPVALDLVVVSSFDDMGGMDESNAALRRLASEAGTSIGAIYGAISELSASHQDQFVEMLSDLATGDPMASPLVALIWYRTLPGEQDNFERHLSDDVVAWERRAGVASETGRFLLSDGWTHLRFLGFDSLGAYQAYWQDREGARGNGYIQGITAVRREIILAPIPELSVR